MSQHDSPMWWTISASNRDGLAHALQGYSALNGQQAAGGDDYHLAWSYQREYQAQRYGSLRDALDSGPQGLSGRFSWLGGLDSIPAPNIVKSAVDTAAAWLISEAPPIACRASGAPFEAQPSLERYGCALDAMFNLPAVSETMKAVGRDGLLRGVGYAMPAYEHGEVTMRRLLPWQMVFDAQDARCGKPRTCLVRDTMDRATLVEWIRERQPRGMQRILDAIKKLPAYRMSSTDRFGGWSVYDYELATQTGRHASDQVAVWYAWRASTSARSGDGRFVLAASSGMVGGDVTVIIDEEYEPAKVAPSWWSPYPNDEGIRGTGLGHVLITWQEALDRSFLKVQRTLDKYGHAKVLCDGSLEGQANVQSFLEAGITLLELPPGVGGDRAIPRLIDPSVLKRDDIEWIERILNWSTSIYGINQLMQQGTGAAVPSASAVALVERADQSKDRFTDVTTEWTAFRLGCADSLLRLLDGVIATNPDFQASYEQRGVPRSDTWAQLSKQVQDVAITLEVRGSAALSRAGRLARAVEWGERGYVSPDEQRELMMDDPDLRKAAGESLAPIRLVEMQLAGVVAATDGDWWEWQPDEDTPLELAIRKAQAMIQIAKVQGAKPETIERLREYKLLAEMLLPAPAAPPVAVPGAEAMSALAEVGAVGGGPVPTM